MLLLSLARFLRRPVERLLPSAVLTAVVLASASSARAQPVLLKDFEGFLGGFQDEQGFFPGDSLLFFAAEDGETDGESPSIWRTDGTLEGTIRVKGLSPYFYGRSDAATLADNLFFVTEGANGFQVWRSDGSSEGTVMLLQTPADDFSLAPHGFTPVDTNHIYFAAYTGLEGMELWRADAGSLSAQLVSDIFPGDDPYSGEKNSSDPDDFAAASSTLFFSADDGEHGRELWKVAPRGTIELVKNIYPDDDWGPNDSNPRGITFGGYEDGTLLPYVVFSAYTREGTEFWRSNGTEAGTFLVEDIDGGVAGSANVTRLTRVHDKIFFVADQDGVGTELWVTGTPGLELVKDIFPGNPYRAPSPSELTDANGILFFTADDGIHGRELWRSDGTSDGTYMVKDIFPGTSGSSPSRLIYHDGLVYFGAAEDSSAYGNVLWQSDGTAAGTVRVDEKYPELGVILEAPMYRAVMNGDLYLGIRRSIWIIRGEPLNFHLWLANHSVPEDQDGVAEDPDGDGLANLMEYALGREPLVPDAGNLPIFDLDDGSLVLRFLRDRPDLDYAIQSTATPWNPGSWTAVEVVERGISGSEVTVELPDGAGDRFFRLVVSLKP